MAENSQVIHLGRALLIKLRFMQILAICPISMGTKRRSLTHMPIPSKTNVQGKNNEKYHLIWCYLNIVIFGILHILVIINHDSTLYMENKFGKFYDFTGEFVIMSAHIITIFESIRKRHAMWKFTKLYSDLHASWANLSFKSDCIIYRRSIFNYIVLVTVTILIHFYYCTRLSTKAKVFRYVTYFTSLTIMRMRFLQFMVYVELLRIEVKYLNYRISCLIARQSAKPPIMLELYEEEIQFLSKSYEIIFEMSEHLKYATSYSIKVIYLLFFLEILWGWYWFYLEVVEAALLVEYWLIILPAVTIYLLLSTCSNFVKTVNLFIHSVYKLRYDIHSPVLAARINYLELQLIHQRIAIDADGFFPLSLGLARPILNSTATFVLFYVQFMTKLNNLK